jgi:hypothetical protein
MPERRSLRPVSRERFMATVSPRTPSNERISRLLMKLDTEIANSEGLIQLGPEFKHIVKLPRKSIEKFTKDEIEILHGNGIFLMEA